MSPAATRKLTLDISNGFADKRADQLTMSPTIYHIIHLVSLFVLFGYTFYAFAAPDGTRKKVLVITGIASLLVLISGFGLISKLYGNHIAPWMIVKFVAWLGLSAFAGLGYRRRGKVGVFAAISVVLVLAAVIAVYTKLSF